MQDLQSIPGGATRFFAGGITRQRDPPHPHPNLKCPRCDSPNTKFCYYNNYNLSQPRHFCKSCRRYWTKGGVLRNVPVGGGCRKSKRSSSSSPSKPSKSSRISKKDHSSTSRSSSESSSSLTVATATTTATTTTDQPSGMNMILPEAASLGYSYADLSGFQQLQDVQHQKMDPNEFGFPDEIAGFVDQSVPVDLPPLFDSRFGNPNAMTGLEWQGCSDPVTGLFDPVTADTGLFWSQNHWPEADPYLLP